MTRRTPRPSLYHQTGPLRLAMTASTPRLELIIFHPKRSGLSGRFSTPITPHLLGSYGYPVEFL
ncbi:MAG: hypothetical protein ACE5JI_01685 [Acidobacteriota bacterium]